MEGEYWDQCNLVTEEAPIFPGKKGQLLLSREQEGLAVQEVCAPSTGKQKKNLFLLTC